MSEETERWRIDEKNSIKPIYKGGKNYKKIAVIGAGWFGAHTAIELSKAGYLVTLHEKNSTIFSGTSGTFGVRIHAGQHYPRSFSTRKTCRDGFYEMLTTYPELCNKHVHSVYALGKIDADGKKSKVEESTFRSVSKEFQFKGEFDLESSPFNPSELLSAYDINEPSAVLGWRLRIFFEEKLQELEVTLKCNFTVTKIRKFEDLIWVGNEHEGENFNLVIDATGFQQAFLPLTKPLPFKINVFYQPCLALVYKDQFPTEKPISFIVMDGWFPCLMPYDDRLTTEKPIAKYIMTHGKWTILGSYRSTEEAYRAFSLVDDSFVQKNIKPVCEKEMIRFWPDFFKRFEYIGWKGSLLGKIKTEREFRGSIVFQEPTIGMISIFPGKITNIFDSSREAQKLVEAQNIKISAEGYRYIEGGVLDTSKIEIIDPIVTEDRNTCSLATFQDTLEKLQTNKPELKTNQFRTSSIANGYSIGNMFKILALESILVAINKNNKDFNKNKSLGFVLGTVELLIAAVYL